MLYYLDVLKYHLFANEGLWPTFKRTLYTNEREAVSSFSREQACIIVDAFKCLNVMGWFDDDIPKEMFRVLGKHVILSSWMCYFFNESDMSDPVCRDWSDLLNLYFEQTLRKNTQIDTYKFDVPPSQKLFYDRQERNKYIMGHHCFARQGFRGKLDYTYPDYMFDQVGLLEYIDAAESLIYQQDVIEREVALMLVVMWNDITSCILEMKKNNITYDILYEDILVSQKKFDLMMSCLFPSGEQVEINEYPQRKRYGPDGFGCFKSNE